MLTPKPSRVKRFPTTPYKPPPKAESLSDSEPAEAAKEKA